MISRSLRAALALALLLPGGAVAQLSGEQTKRSYRMLETLRKELDERYYDPAFRGVPLEQRYAKAQRAISGATTMPQVFAALADFVAGLGDSHTMFLPPPRAADVEYGFRVLFVGDSSYVSEVKAGSLAEAAGLEAGSRLLAIDGMHFDRSNFWLQQYLYNVLNPRAGVVLVVRTAGGAMKQLEVPAKVTERQLVLDLDDPHAMLKLRDEWYRDADRLAHRWAVVDDVMVWRMPTFEYGAHATIDQLLREARRHRALVLDLRDNPGGALRTQLHLLGRLFGEKVDVATVQERNKSDRLVAKPAGDVFTGDLIVLVNSASASSAEMVARTVQLTGRGRVVGDRTAGAVNVSIYRPQKVGFEKFWPYGLQVTVGEVVMADGNRLEGVGVTPDVLVLPSAHDLRDGRDPVLAHALRLAGAEIDPAAAGQMFAEQKKR